MSLNPEQENRLVEGAQSLGVPLDSRAVERFGLYLDALMEWNTRHNLTAIRDRDEVIVRHFLDSLTCVRGYDFGTGRPVLDVGAGAGFPGLPLKIAFPDLSLSLLDSSLKKVEFLRHVIQIMGFQDMDVIHGRAEDLGHSGAYRQRFHLAVARAVAPLPVLLELCLPFVVTGGWFLAQKNRELGEEWTQGVQAATLLGGGSPEMIAVSTPGLEGERSLVRVRKEQGTPSNYPRRPGIPAKRPVGTRPPGRSPQRKR